MSHPCRSGHYTWFILAVLSALLGIASCARREPPPIVVLVTIDTLRSDRVGCYGDTAAHTPNLDALALDGVLLERAVTTVPVTLPSHATILTGTLPPTHGVLNNGSYRLDPGAVTLAERFLEAGYRTGAFVSSFVLHRQFGLNQGFEAYDDSLYNERPGSHTVARALAWIDRPDKRPCFLWVHLFEPHTPWNPPAPYAALPLRSGYEREVAAADGFLGHLLDGLRERGLYDRALIAVMSDHGEGLGDHGEAEHGIFLYRETTWIPWIFRLPEGRGAGLRVPDLVSSADLAPTVLELCGLPALPAAEGLSLTPLFAGGELPPRHGVYMETVYPRENFGWAPLYAFETPLWKWIRAPESELYDMREDPGELFNLAVAHPDTAARLDRRLERLLLSAPAAQPTDAAMSSEVAERLRSLGYLSAGGLVTQEDGDRPDPKRMIAHHGDMEAAKRAMDDRRYAAAIEPFRRVLAHQERNLVALLGLGMALNRTARYDEAEEIYRAAIELSPANTTAIAGLADAFFGQEDWSDALELYRLAARDPAQLRYTRTRAILCLSRLGRQAEADQDLAATIRVLQADRSSLEEFGRRLATYRAMAVPAPGDTAALSRARLAFALGFLTEAEQLLKRPLRDPASERVRLLLLEDLHSGLGRPAAALEALRQTQRNDGVTTATRAREADLLLLDGRPVEALDVYDAIAMDEISGSALLANVLYNKACALARLGRYDEAMTALHGSVRAGYRKLGHILNDPDLEALRELPRFLSIADTLSQLAAAAGEAGQPHAH